MFADAENSDSYLLLPLSSFAVDNAFDNFINLPVHADQCNILVQTMLKG